jgi:hypothetical protein
LSLGKPSRPCALPVTTTTIPHTTHTHTHAHTYACITSLACSKRRHTPVSRELHLQSGKAGVSKRRRSSIPIAFIFPPFGPIGAGPFYRGVRHSPGRSHPSIFDPSLACLRLPVRLVFFAFCVHTRSAAWHLQLDNLADVSVGPRADCRATRLQLPRITA